MHHVEHAHTDLVRHWCEPRRRLQSDEHVGKPLFPSRHTRGNYCRLIRMSVTMKSRPSAPRAFPTCSNLKLVPEK